MIQLAELKIGESARIKALKPDNDVGYRHRLLTLGLIPGTEVQLLKVAPFGDPVEISVRGSALVLRKAEASLLELEVIDHED